MEPLSGFRIVHEVETTGEKVEFRFHSKSKIHGGSSVTVGEREGEGEREREREREVSVTIHHTRCGQLLRRVPLTVHPVT